jgi:hypothetical protein
MDLKDFSNIDGTVIGVLLNYREEDAITLTDHQVPATLLPSSLLQIPLSQFMNNFWGVDKDKQNTTARERATSAAVAGLQGIKAQNIDGAFPQTGRLFAVVDKHTVIIDESPQVVPQLLLVFSLPNASFAFNVGPAAFRLTFDTFIRIVVDVPNGPQPITATGSTLVDDAHLKPTNFAASLLNLVASGFVAAVADSLDRSTPLDVSALGGKLAELSPLLASERASGFTGTKIRIDANSIGPDDPATVFFQLIHPIVSTPVLRDATPSLFKPVLSTSQSQIHSGEQLLATGSDFDLTQTAVRFEWDAAGSSAADIEVTPPNPPQRLRSNTPGQFTLTNAAPNSHFQIRVRNRVALEGPLSDSHTTTCSDFSEVFSAHSGAAAGDQVEITLHSSSGVVSVAKTTLGSNGRFSVSVPIPAGTVAGACTLVATFDHQSASADILVLDPTALAQPVLQVINTLTNAPDAHPSGVEEEKVTVRGEDFIQGSVSLTTGTARPLATASVLANGTFLSTFFWPAQASGDQQIIASQLAGGTTQRTNLAITIQQHPG